MIPKEIRTIVRNEKRFSRNGYDGAKKAGFVIVPGTIPVMVSAPHAVGHFRNGRRKDSDKFTGAIAMYLHKITGCHIIYATGSAGVDANYDPLASNPYQNALIRYVKEHGIPVLIDLHGAASSRPYAVEMGTAPVRDADKRIVGDAYASLKGHGFIARLIRYSFEHALKGLEGLPVSEVWENRIFDAGGQNTVTKAVSGNSDAAAIQLEMNGHFRNPEHPERFLALLRGLETIIRILSSVHWNAEYIDVFKLRQSKRPVPQDKVELAIGGTTLYDGDIIEISSALQVPEYVRVRDFEGEQGCIYLTNRLIHNVFSKEWSIQEGYGDVPALEGAPVLVSDRQETAFSFGIGITKALKLDRVYLSSLLYERLKPLSNENLFVAYNRITDSRLYLDFDEETDYRDDPYLDPPKVMLPRYFKQLLGYNTFPFNLFRKEEFGHLPAVFRDKLRKRIETISSALAKGDAVKEAPLDRFILDGDEDYSRALAAIESLGIDSYLEGKSADLFARIDKCYSPVGYTAFNMLNDDCDEQSRAEAEDIFRRFGYYDSVEILVVPKQKKDTSFFSRLKDAANRFVEWGLSRIIGKSDYLLTTCWTSETDDKNHVARLSPNMMSLLGITDNDKVVIRYGERTITVRILANPELTDYQIGVPANARTFLNMYSVNDVVVVSRDMRHTFKRNSQAQTIAILGTVLAVFQVISRLWIGVVICLVSIPLIIYFSLNEERIKVK